MSSQYGTLEDCVRLGVATGTAARIPAATLTAQLLSKSAYADGFLRVGYVLPLVSYGDDLRECVCALAVEGALETIGWNPEDPASKPILERANRWRRWLARIAEGSVDPGFVDSTPTVRETGTFVVTNRKRGWR